MQRNPKVEARFADDSAFIADLEHHIDPHRYGVTEKDGRHWVQLGGHHDVPFRGPKKKRPFGARQANVNGYEPVVTLLLSRLVQLFGARSFLDIGASRGYFSMVAASAIDAAPEAYAFEMRRHFDLVLNRLPADSPYRNRIHPYHAGMSDTHRGPTDIWYSRTNMFEAPPEESAYREAWWRRLKFRLRGVKDRDRLERVSVLVTSVDHFCRENAIVPDIIKIDVDGYEAKVLPGAMETIAAHRPFVLFELHNSEKLGRFGLKRRDVVRPLFDLGCRAFQCEDHTGMEGARLRPVALDDPIFDHEKTDFFLFF